MNAEIISVGTELLLGDILNTNTQYLSKELRTLGIDVYNHQSVGDNRDRLKEALFLALSRSDVVITVAGLGPTDDDITCETVCNALGLQMTYDTQIEEELREYYERHNRIMPDEALKQAVVPLGATILHNKIGTAPGHIINGKNKCVIMLPGPPDELKSIFTDPLVKEKLKEYSAGIIKSETVRVIGLGELEVANRIAEFTKYTNPTVATYSNPGEVEVTITATGEDETAVAWLIDPTVEKITAKLGYTVYGYGDTTIQREVVKRLLEKRMKIATAESCTAGLLSKAITDVEGASAVFEMGVSTYSAEKKMQLLGVCERTLKTEGEVSAQTSREMAAGVLLNSGADIGVGITGIAGPGGGTPEKQVGLVYISVANREFVYTGMINVGNRDRDYIREVAVKSALDMVRRLISGFGVTLGQPVPTAVIERFLTKKPTAVVEASTSIQGNIIETSDDEESVEIGYIPPSPALTPGFMIKEDTAGDNVDVSVEDIYSKQNETADGSAKAPSMADRFRESVPSNLEKYDQMADADVAPFVPFDPSQTQQSAYSNPTAYANNEESKSVFSNIIDKIKAILPAKKEKQAEDVPASDYISPNEQDDVSLVSPDELSADTSAEKKRPWYLNLLFWFVPEKSDGKFIAIKIMRIICVVALIVSLVMISAYYIDQFRYQSGNDSLVGKYNENDNSTNEKGILNNMQQFVDMNSDTVGYLKIAGIDATGPVVQGTDNDFYLDHDFFKTQTRFGARFADFNATDLKKGNLTQNTVIYGHYSETGEVFGDLNKYEDVEFFKEHAVIEFSTLYEKSDWKVVSVFLTNTLEEHDANGVFNYRANQFADQEAFLQFVTEMKRRSIINTGVDVIENDKLLTLSTCSRVFDEARFVVVARQVRQGESSQVDLNTIEKNPYPLYPDVWYEIFGGTKPVFSDVGEIVTTTIPLTTAPTEATTEVTTEAPTEAPTPAPTKAPTSATTTQPTVQVIQTTTAPPTTTQPSTEETIPSTDLTTVAESQTQYATVPTDVPQNTTQYPQYQITTVSP